MLISDKRDFKIKNVIEINRAFSNETRINLSGKCKSYKHTSAQQQSPSIHEAKLIEMKVEIHSSTVQLETSVPHFQKWMEQLGRRSTKK